jgi:hypothetical protein
VWMQVYELTVDVKTNKASATVEYDIASTANDSAIHIVESTDQMKNTGTQMTLVRALSATNFRIGCDLLPGATGTDGPSAVSPSGAGSEIWRTCAKHH